MDSVGASNRTIAYVCMRLFQRISFCRNIIDCSPPWDCIYPSSLLEPEDPYQQYNRHRDLLSTSTPYPRSQGQSKFTSNENLDWWVRTVLLPTAMLLIAICFILGVILVVKSYMMTSLKQNLATAIRRRRQTGHAPNNQYIAPAEMRASRPCSDRKSFPPPEVLLAARERASQIYTV